MKCRKCGSENLAVRKNAKNEHHTDLYCQECGAWQKFATSDEIRLYSQPDHIDPETLPIVQELREKLERVTAERDAARRDYDVAKKNHAESVEQMTNADKIRRMTDEELVLFLDEFSANCIECTEDAKNKKCPIYRCGRYCEPSHIMNWLQQQAKED